MSENHVRCSTLHFYRERQFLEARLTLAVLQAIPATALGYTPHPQSPRASDICSTLLRCLRVCVALTGVADAEMTFAEPERVEDVVEAFDYLSTHLTALLQSEDDAFWGEPAIVRARGVPVLQQPRSDIFWLFLFDAIHHRGQLTTYLRPMGARVPSVYGRSEVPISSQDKEKIHGSYI